MFVSVLTSFALALPPQLAAPPARYDQDRLVRRITDHHWNETVFQTDYSGDTAVTTARNVSRSSRNWSVETGVGTPILTTMDFADRVGDVETISRLDKQSKNTRWLAVAGVAGGLATSVIGYRALSRSDNAPTGMGLMVPSLGLSVAGLSILPHLFVQQKRGSVHANYSEPEVDGWIRRHNDALAAQTGAEAQRGAYPDVEQVAAYH